jgi:hypothetical protein
MVDRPRITSGPTVARAWRKLQGLQQAGRKVLGGLVDSGPTYTYHLLREYLLLQDQRRADLEPHLAARLNTLAQSRSSTLGAALRDAHCRDVRALSYELIAERHDELAQRLALAPPGDILDLYGYFRYFGDFRSAEFLRTQALHACVRWQERVPHVIPDALAAAIELGKAEFVLETVNSKRLRVPERAQVHKAVAVAHALRGEAAKAQRLWDDAREGRDFAYHQAIRGRRVALIGPAPATDGLREEVDSFDLLVRTNYDGKVDPRYGSRTDISYYNGSRVVSQRQEIAAVAPSLQWLIGTRGSKDDLSRLLPHHPGIRAADVVHSLFFHANPLAVPNILLDLMRFQPATIKIFSSDFFSSDVAYGSNYHQRTPKIAGIAHALRVHDPFSSFSLAQQLKDAGLVAADDLGEKVLSLDRRAYAARLQQLYGDHAVANRHPNGRGAR